MSISAQLKAILFPIAVGAVAVGAFLVPHTVQAASTTNLAGYAWSSNIGWVSFGCVNTNSCATSDYGVQEAANGNLSGYAWSSNVGWISFDQTTGCPETGCTTQPKVSISSGAVSGWAKVLSAASGWDGWIKLGGSWSPSPTFSSKGVASGYSWGGDVMGWLSWGGSGYGVTTAANLPKVTLAAQPTSVAAGSSSQLQWAASNTTSCTGTNFSTGGKVSGTATVTPSQTTTYTVTCTNAYGSTQSSATVTILPPAVTLAASPTSVTQGGSSTVSWSATPSAGTSCKSSTLASVSGASGQTTVKPKQTTTYDVTCTDAGGSTTATTTVSVLCPDGSSLNGRTSCAAPTVSFTASPTSITSGGSSTLSWTSNNATSCTTQGFIISNWFLWGSANTSGSQSVSPAQTTTYGVTCQNASGTATASATVTVTAVTPGPLVSLSASPTSITSGGSSRLSWSSTNAASCSANFSTGGKLSGTTNVTPAQTTTYSIACTNTQGTNTATTSVAVTCANGANNPPACDAPTVSLKATPTSINPGSTAQLSWSASANTTSCSAFNFSTGGKLNGTTNVKPSQTTTYSISCINANGSASASAQVAVTNNPVPLTVSLGASPTSINKGGSSQLTWSSSGSSCTGTNFSTGGQPSGSLTVKPNSTTTYSITCTSSTAGVSPKSASVTVSVQSTTPTITSFYAQPNPVNSGNKSALFWASTNATSCTGGGFSTGGATSNTTGVSVGPLKSNANYTLKCTGPGGSSPQDAVTITVSNPGVSIVAQPARLQSGEYTYLTWSSSDVKSGSCSVKGTDGFSATGDNKASIKDPTPITSQTTYTITCKEAIGGTQISNSTTVVIAPVFNQF